MREFALFFALGAIFGQMIFVNPKTEMRMNALEETVMELSADVVELEGRLAHELHNH